MDRCAVFEDYLDWVSDRRFDEFDESKKLKLSLEKEFASTESAIALLKGRHDELVGQVRLLLDRDVREALHELSLEVWQVGVEERGLREDLNTASKSIALIKALLARAKQTTFANGVADMAFYRGIFMKVFCRVLVEVTGDSLIMRRVSDSSEVQRLQLASVRSVCCEELSGAAPTGLYSEFALKVDYAVGSTDKLRTALFRIKEIRETLKSVAVGSGGLGGLAIDSCNFTGFCATLVSSLSVYCQRPEESGAGAGDGDGGSGHSEANINGDKIRFERGLDGEGLFEGSFVERRWSFEGEPRRAARARGLSEGSSSSSSSSSKNVNTRRGSSAAQTTPLKAAFVEATTAPQPLDRPSFLAGASPRSYSVAFSATFPSPTAMSEHRGRGARESEGLSLSAATTFETSSHNANSGLSDSSGVKVRSRVRSLLELLARLREDRDAVSASLVDLIATRERLLLDMGALRLVAQRCLTMLVGRQEGSCEELLATIAPSSSTSQRTEEQALLPLRRVVEELVSTDRQLQRAGAALSDVLAARAQNGAQLKRLQRLELLSRSGRGPSGADIDKADLYDVAI